MKRVADTSALVASLDAQDARRGEAIRVLREAKPLVVPTEVLVEFVGVVSFRLGRDQARQAVSALVSMPNVEWEERSDLVAVLALYAKGQGLSLVDCFVVDSCLRHRCPPATFDEAQERAVRKGLASAAR